MNSLLSHLGPGYSRRNRTIILGFILLIIAIAVATYFLTRGDDDDDKDKKDENTSENVPSIEDPTVTRTLLPDSYNSSESGTTETYEIGGCKTETYQIEYNGGISDTVLSKNVSIGITWSNKSGFENVTKLDIEHYVDNVKKNTKPINRYDVNGVEIPANKNYFKIYAKGLTQEFQGLEPTIKDDNGTDIPNPAAYSFVGTHTIKIIATYTGEDSEGKAIDINITLTEGTTTKTVEVKTEDLAATLNLTVPEVRVYTPIQSYFAMKDAEIDNELYYATSEDLDIHKSIVGNSSVKPFTLIRASANNSNSNQFYFKFSETQYLGHTNGKLSIDSADNKKIITLVSSSLDTTDGVRYFRLSFGNDLYAVLDENRDGAVKTMVQVKTETVFDTLEWKLSTNFPSTCDASSTTVNSITNSGCPSDLASGSTCQPTCKDGYRLAGYTDCYFGNKIKVATCFLYQYEFIMNIKSSALGPHIEHIFLDDTLLTKDQTFIHIIPTHNNNSDNMFIDDDSLSKWGRSGYSTNDKIFTIGSNTQIKQIKIVYSEPQYVPGWIIKENGITVITDTGNGGALQTPEHVTYTYDIENGTSASDTPQLASFVKYEKKKFKSDVTGIWIDAGRPTNANPGTDRSDKENTIAQYQYLSAMLDSGNNLSACKTKCVDMDKCKSILYYPKQNKCYFSGVEANSDNIEDNPSETTMGNTHLYGIIRPKGDSCDTSTPPTNGTIGDCVSELEDGETCQPICNSGYAVSGNSSCDDGVLTAATCSAKNSYTKVTGIVIGPQNAFDDYDLNMSMWGTIDECKEKCDTIDTCKGFQGSLTSEWRDGKWRYPCRFKSMDIQNPVKSGECGFSPTDFQNCSEHAVKSNWQRSYRKVPTPQR